MFDDQEYLGSVIGAFLLVAAIVGLFFIHDCIKDNGREEIRKEAIEAGVACYYCYPKTAKCSFLWGKNWKQCEEIKALIGSKSVNRNWGNKGATKNTVKSSKRKTNPK